MVPPPATYSPSYNTTACPGVIALCGSSNTHSNKSLSLSLIVHQAPSWLYLILALTLIPSCGFSILIKLRRLAYSFPAITSSFLPTTTSLVSGLIATTNTG